MVEGSQALRYLQEELIWSNRLLGLYLIPNATWETQSKICG